MDFPGGVRVAGRATGDGRESKAESCPTGFASGDWIPACAGC